jgi:diguanylate cyclase (GGDEF)-like protein
MDIPSLFFVEATILFLFGIIMLIDSIGQESQAGNYWVAASNFCGAIGLLLRPLFPHASLLVVLLIPNLLLFVELALLNKAIAEFVGHGRSLWLFFLAFAALITAASAYVVYCHPNPTLLADLLSSITITFPACSAVLLFRYAASRLKIQAFSMATFFSLYALNNLLRLFHDWTNQHQRFDHILFDRTILAGLSVSYLLLSEAHLRYRLLDLVNLDPLTGLLNRRALETEAIRRVEAGLAQGRNVSVLVLDIDQFKSINDRYGHDAGDLALKAVADSLRRTMRDSDLLIRFGGDEFLVILAGASAQQAAEAADRLRAHLATLRIPSGDGDFHIQTSIGVSTLDRKGLTLQELIKRGDQNLYAAKSANLG